MLRRFRLIAGATILCAILLLAGPVAFATQPQTVKSNLVTMNFDDVDISVLARFISQITGKNIVFDDDVTGKVSVVAPSKVTPAQAYCIFLSALQIKGFAAIETGPVVRILPAREARAIAQVTNSQTPAGECAKPLDLNGPTSASHTAPEPPPDHHR
jgi:type II secretory pathway component GspD/PulD (secretin)